MIMMKKNVYLLIVNILMAVLIFQPAVAKVKLVKSQTIYVPVYSHIYYGDKEKYYFLLSATLSIRNTDMQKSITVTAVEYYDSKGALLEKLIPQPVTLKPLESVRYIIKESDTRGGSGANFIVKWKADVPVNEPIIESVMIGAHTQYGLSFTSRGQVLRED